MSNLDFLRTSIEEIDKEMLDLFVKRMAISYKVAKFKKENNLPVFDEKRENILKNRNLSLLNNSELEKYYLIFLEGVLDSSKFYQKDIIERTGK